MEQEPFRGLWRAVVWSAGQCVEKPGEKRVRHAWVLRREGTGKAAEGWARGGRELGGCLWRLKQRKEKGEHWRVPVRAYSVSKRGGEGL